MTDLPILGVDAGGTGTRAVLAKNGDIVSRYADGPLNVLLHADALDRLTALIKKSGASVAGLGLAGIRGAQEALRLELELRDRTGVPVVIGDDVEIALLGSFDGGPGIVVISGTGSNAFGRDAHGRAARVGGHGFLLGDEGSAYWIGRQALRAALRSRDGTGPTSAALEEAITEAYGLDLDGVVRQVHTTPADRRQVSRITPAILRLDDPVTKGIAAAAAAHLITMVQALRRRLGDLPVAMHGGVFRADAIRRPFVSATGAVDPARPPEFGAVILAATGGGQRDMGWAQ